MKDKSAEHWLKVRLRCAQRALQILSSTGFRARCIGMLLMSKRAQPL